METNVRERLKEYQLSSVWLINQLNKQGIQTDKTEISSVFAGTRKGPKADTILAKSDEILNRYQQLFINSE